MENALIIPTHPAKVNWLILFLNSIPIHEVNNLNFNIILAVSNHSEKQKINNVLRISAPLIHPYIIYFDVHEYIHQNFNDKDILDRYIKNDKKCIVNFKKFIAMHWAKSQYSYLTVIDADTLFYKSTKNIFTNLIENYQENRYLGSPSQHPAIIDILKSCASFFDHDSSLQIEKATKNFTLYTWFLDPPTYQREDLLDFFDYILSPERTYNFWSKLDWFSFEHIIFVYYRFLYKNTTLIDYSESAITNRVPEQLNLNDLNILKNKYNYSPAWVRFNLLLNGIDSLQTKQPSLLYHVDRM